MVARRHHLQQGAGQGSDPAVAILRARARHAARTNRLQVITAALSRAVTREEVARTLVERTLGALDAEEGGVWSLDPGMREARLVFVHQASRPDARDAAEISPGVQPPAPLGEALARGEPVFVASRPQAELRWPDAAHALSQRLPGEYALACLPLEAEGRVVGGASFAFRGPHPFDHDEQAFLVVVAGLAAQALLRAQLYDSERAAHAEAEADRQRATFLGEASAVLASSHDWEAALSSVATLAVPGIADWCSVEVPETLASGALPIAIRHADPALVARMLEWRRRWPPDTAAAAGPPAVLRTGRAELYEDLPHAVLAAQSDVEALRMARELGLTSAMVVPLCARGRTLGAITLIAAESGRRYGPADLATAEELGRRAGMAIDHSRSWEEAQRAIRARDEVLAVVSHDLKNPLEAVLLCSSLLLRSPESPRVRRYADALQRSARRMDRLIHALLDLSLVDAGRFRVELRPERLDALVDEALALLAPLAAAKQIGLAAVGGPLAAHVSCDRERILQVITNLVGNALEFTPRGGRVTVRLELREADAEVAVSDDGPGIRPEDLPRVFDRYWKRDSGRGTGLGLAIARGIMDAHGGRIRVESRVGEGSTFAFTLPR